MVGRWAAATAARASSGVIGVNLLWIALERWLMLHIDTYTAHRTLPMARPSSRCAA